MPSSIQKLLIVASCTSLSSTSGFLLNHNHPAIITSSSSTTTTTTCSSSTSSPLTKLRADWIADTNTAVSYRKKSSKLWLEFPNFFSGGQFNFNPFGGNGNNDDGDENKGGNSSSDGVKENDGGDAIEADGEYVSSTEIFHIPAKKIKIGGLRLYLALYFMGEQNTPTRMTWRADQTASGGIDLYYRDRTGALLITFTEESMTVGRLGSAPSMDYLTQESAILSGMLDQLDEISDDSSIGEANRLLQLLEPGDAIETVRENLAFG